MTDLPTSQPFKLTPATYFRIVAGAKLPTLLATALLILFISTVAAVIVDLRIILVGLILIFLVIPFIALHIYYNILLTADARFALSRKTVTFHPDGSITETFLPADEPDSDPIDETATAHTTSSNIPQPRTFQPEDLINTRRTSRFTIITINTGYILIIPHTPAKTQPTK